MNAIGACASEWNGPGSAEGPIGLVNGPDRLPFMAAYVFPIRLRNPDGLSAVAKGTWHLGSELIGRCRELPTAVRADEFEGIGRQFDILRCRHHEFFAAIGTIHHGMEKFLSRREAGGTVRAFKSQWHNEVVKQLSYLPIRDHQSGKVEDLSI